MPETQRPTAVVNLTNTTRRLTHLRRTEKTLKLAWALTATAGLAALGFSIHSGIDTYKARPIEFRVYETVNETSIVLRDLTKSAATAHHHLQLDANPNSEKVGMGPAIIGLNERITALGAPIARFDGEVKRLKADPKVTAFMGNLNHSAPMGFVGIAGLGGAVLLRRRAKRAHREVIKERALLRENPELQRGSGRLETWFTP